MGFNQQRFPNGETMRLLILPLIFCLTACSTFSPKPEELKTADKCMVWQPDTLGIVQTREVEGELARQKMTCWVMNMFLCSYINYTFKNGTGEILTDIGDKNKPIGKLESNVISISRTGVKVDPALIKDGRIDYELQGPIGPKQNKTVFYNEKCSVRQAALGAATFM